MLLAEEWAAMFWIHIAQKITLPKPSVERSGEESTVQTRTKILFPPPSLQTLEGMEGFRLSTRI